jgi:hypothetical protein
MFFRGALILLAAGFATALLVNVGALGPLIDLHVPIAQPTAIPLSTPTPLTDASVALASGGRRQDGPYLLAAGTYKVLATVTDTGGREHCGLSGDLIADTPADNQWGIISGSHPVVDATRLFVNQISLPRTERFTLWTDSDGCGWTIRLSKTV